jgi:hypothetical protein
MASIAIRARVDPISQSNKSPTKYKPAMACFNYFYVQGDLCLVFPSLFSAILFIDICYLALSAQNFSGKLPSETLL